MIVYVVLGSYRVRNQRQTVVLGVYRDLATAEDAMQPDGTLDLPWIESLTLVAAPLQ